MWTFIHPWKIDVTFRDSGYNLEKEFSLSSAMEETETYSSYLLLMGVQVFYQAFVNHAFHGVHVCECVCE